VPEILELAQLLQHDGVAQMQVRCRRVQTELDAQRRTGRQALLERTRREAVHGVASQLCGGV
jgi:hypothetical protein